MHRFINQLNVSITTNRTCTLRCKHCYIAPELFKDKEQMSKETYRKIFSQVENLYSADNNLKEIEWEAIGGETTMMPFEWWEEMLPWTLERIQQINARLENPGSLNFLTNLIYTDQRYTDLFNTYGDHPAFCLYTSWEPDTMRFGTRGQLYNRWKSTLSSIKAKTKILDIILTKKVIELGPRHLIDEFVPLGITDFSIKMLSPYGSGKRFFEPNMIDFKSMTNYLIELDKIKPEHITYTPQEEMSSSLYRGTSFQCNGNFKYDLSIEPNGETHFNANQTGDEAALGSRVIHIEDPNWAAKVMFENKTEENAKLSLAHDSCHQCEYMSYCNAGWYHYKVQDPVVISKYDKEECPGYRGLWDYHSEKFPIKHSRALNNHRKAIRQRVMDARRGNSEKPTKSFVKLSDLSDDYEAMFNRLPDIGSVHVNTPLLYGKNIVEWLWFLDDLRVQTTIDNELLMSSPLCEVIIDHFVSSNWNTVSIPSEVIWRWSETAKESSFARVLREAGQVVCWLLDGEPSYDTAVEKDLIIDERHDELFRWVFANPPVNYDGISFGVSDAEVNYLCSLRDNLEKESLAVQSLIS